MAATKVTKRDNFEALRLLVAEATAPDAVKIRLTAFIDHEIDLLTRKHSATRALTSHDRENIALKQEIVRVLNSHECLTATRVAHEISTNVQRATALLTALVKDNVLTRDPSGKNVTFAVNESRFTE